MAQTQKYFKINFGTGICGLEILFKESTKSFIVGAKFYSATAKKFAAILENAEILALNDEQTYKLGSMQQIQNMFKEAGKSNKTVWFVSEAGDDSKLTALAADPNNSELTITTAPPYSDGLNNAQSRLGGVAYHQLSDKQYTISLPRRPLGFTIAASPSGTFVEVVQVDSVHEEDVHLGSKLIAVNRRQVTDLKFGIEQLLNCKLPADLLLETTPESEMFANDEEKEQVGASLAYSSYDKKDELVLSVEWFSKDLAKELDLEPFKLYIGKNAPVAMVRAKIAAVSQLKFEALNLISGGSLLKNDDAILSDIMKDMKSASVQVVVSLKTQNATKPVQKVDYKVAMKTIGAYLMSEDKAVLSYLWDDIDHEKKGLLHITELDRLLARMMGLYERAACIKPNMEWKHDSVKFSTSKNLGLVIEGNEVIMCHKGSQAEEQGILPGWKVVGAEYTDKNGDKIKFPVDHKSCLQSLKRAKQECQPSSGFKVLCDLPCGPRYETQIIMKKQAIAMLRLDDGSQTLTRKHYDKLPAIFADGAVRVVIAKRPADDKLPIELQPNSVSAKPGAFVKETSIKTVGVGAELLDVNGTPCTILLFDNIMKIYGTEFPMAVTFAAPPEKAS